MRITADIIDEDSYLISKEIPEQSSDRNRQNRTGNIFSLNNNLSHLSRRSAKKHQERVGLQNAPQHTQTLQEVTKKFQNLNLSDMLPSTSQGKNSCHFGHASSQESNLEELVSKLEKFEPVDFSGVPKAGDSAPSFLQNFNSKTSRENSRKEPSNMPNLEPINFSDSQNVGNSLQCYMARMKQEIKKEILEELLSISPDIKQEKISEALSCNTRIIGKEENNLQYQGEVVHTGIYCDNCDQLIHGIRYKCGNCSDFDLCQECESLPNVHSKNHIFLKIRYPFALRMYQKQKWQELMSPIPQLMSPMSQLKPSRFNDSAYSKNQAKKLYEAKFICDETVPDSTVIPPSTHFVKSWKVMNSGTRVWTHATKLHLIQGSAELIPISQQVDVPHLKPGEEGIVSVLFTSPSSPGVYRSHWNFCHKSRPFGHIVWCHIIVKPNQKELRTDQSVSSDVNELSEKIGNKQMEVTSIAQVLTAVKEDQMEDNMVPRKLIVNSHTATPNNTPFALTPPKSPDHETLTKSVQEIASEKTFFSHCNDSDNEDDECSVLSISSSDSDTEFVVIPMPKCFNLSESFVSQHFHLSQDLLETGNTLRLNPDEAKEKSSMQNTMKKQIPVSETVSQETGVPELSENTLTMPQIICVESVKQKPKTRRISLAETGGSSSEISVIESEGGSPTVENSTQTFDTINIKLTTDNVSNQTEVERIEIHLTDVPSKETATSYVSASDKVGIEEPTTDIPCSATFPKFPVEGVTGEMYEGATSNNLNIQEERTIQVLPEGLVIGALSAAATVYNTARAVISTIQQPKTGTVESLSQPLPNDQHGNHPSTRIESLNPMDQLIEMGFCNRQQNEPLLKKHNGDVALVVAELVSLSDNDWYASRHIPSSPPGFLD